MSRRMTATVRIRTPLVVAAQLGAVVVTVEEEAAVATEMSPRTAVARGVRVGGSTAVVPEEVPTPDASVRHMRSRKERPPD